jgi:hypothetical protein
VQFRFAKPMKQTGQVQCDRFRGNRMPPFSRFGVLTAPQPEARTIVKIAA